MSKEKPTKILSYLKTAFCAIDKTIAPAQYANGTDETAKGQKQTDSKRHTEIRGYISCGCGILAGMIFMATFQAIALGIILIALSLLGGIIIFRQEYLIQTGEYNEVPAICTGIENPALNLLRLRKVCEFEVDDAEHKSFTLTFDSGIRVSKGKKYLIYFKKGGTYVENNMIKIKRF